MFRSLREQLKEKFRDRVYRHAYANSFLDSQIATQIKAIREQRGLTQLQLAELAGMKQSRISALEDVNYSSWSIATLKRLAKAFDLAPVFTFETFGSLTDRATSFDRPTLERESFEADPVFQELPTDFLMTYYVPVPKTWKRSLRVPYDTFRVIEPRFSAAIPAGVFDFRTMNILGEGIVHIRSNLGPSVTQGPAGRFADSERTGGTNVAPN